MIATAVFALCAAVVFWVYFGYPLFLLVVARLRPRPRSRAPMALPVSIVVPAHNEEAIIRRKIENIGDSKYPSDLVEVVVASDGSSDRTVQEARLAGAGRVLDLPRVGKVRALVEAAEVASGEVLVFTDADSLFEPDTLPALLSNFHDPRVGGVSAREILASPDESAPVARGEGLYWRYEQWLKRLEDRVGSTVSASGRLYALRRTLFRPPRSTAGADDFLISTEVVRAGSRLAFDERARVLVDSPAEGGDELRRKVRVMNGGLRAALSLGRLAVPLYGGLYGLEVTTHKIARRLVPLFLLGFLGSSASLAAGEPLWWIVLGPQIVFYALAGLGWVGHGRPWGRRKLFWIPYYFCLGNVAAALAILSLLRGVRYETWTPSRRTGDDAEAINGSAQVTRSR
jgi:cellulose synthase/poly-beta-1,6-N-acetylglucosamine synthase-like glycosyltransferase